MLSVYIEILPVCEIANLTMWNCARHSFDMGPSILPWGTPVERMWIFKGNILHSPTYKLYFSNHPRLRMFVLIWMSKAFFTNLIPMVLYWNVNRSASHIWFGIGPQQSTFRRNFIFLIASIDSTYYIIIVCDIFWPFPYNNNINWNKQLCMLFVALQISKALQT